MLKQAASAAAISSSGLLPPPFSKRDTYVTFASLSAPLAVETMPEPPLRSPRQVDVASRLNSAIVLSFFYPTTYTIHPPHDMCRRMQQCTMNIQGSYK